MLITEPNHFLLLEINEAHGFLTMSFIVQPCRFCQAKPFQQVRLPACWRAGGLEEI